MGVDWTREIVDEVAGELGFAPQIALIYSEQDKTRLSAKARDGRITSLPPAADYSDDVATECRHIVALMGPEPFIEALKHGADIVLAGRTTDAAILAAVPLMNGAGVASAWHAGKIAECGGLCTEDPRGGGVLIEVGRDHFDVRPLSPETRCTPESVSAHMLYENSDPFRLYEPGGVLDATDARYEQLDSRTVRVSGSRWEKGAYTMKLEGASSGPFQTIMMIGIQDPDVLSDLPAFLERMSGHLDTVVQRTFPGLEGWSLSFRPYGYNAVSGTPVKPDYIPQEIGLMMIVTAPTQDLATRIAKSLNSTFFHFPRKPGIPLPSYAYPFSPAEIERGQVHEFRLNHVVSVDDPLELVRLSLQPVKVAAQ